MHMACYHENESIGCVLHAHPKESFVFATLGMDMPNLTEATQKLGKIPTLEYRPATTVELAETVRKHIISLGEKVTPAAMLLNRHGILITDETLHKAYDMLERIEYNAYVASKALVFEKLGIAAILDEVSAH